MSGGQSLFCCCHLAVCDCVIPCVNLQSLVSKIYIKRECLVAGSPYKAAGFCQRFPGSFCYFRRQDVATIQACPRYTCRCRTKRETDIRQSHTSCTRDSLPPVCAPVFLDLQPIVCRPCPAGGRLRGESRHVFSLRSDLVARRSRSTALQAVLSLVNDMFTLLSCQPFGKLHQTDYFLKHAFSSADGYHLYMAQM